MSGRSTKRAQSRHGMSLNGGGIPGHRKMAAAAHPASKTRANDPCLPEEEKLPTATRPKTTRPTGPMDAAVARYRPAPAGSICVATARRDQAHKALLARKQVNTSNASRGLGT